MTLNKKPNAFGTFVDPFVLKKLESIPKDDIYGLSIFAVRFFRYLLRYSDFDEFHLFSLGLPSETRESRLSESDSRIRIRPLNDFGPALSETNFVVLHNPWGVHIGPLIDLRNRVGNRNIPVTGLTHTISYQSLLSRTVLTMALGMKPWDSIICTAECAVVTMQNWISHLRDELGERINVDYQGRLDKIPLGVDSEIFCRREKGESRRHFGLPQDHVIILYLGRFSTYDKMDLAPLLLAFKNAMQQEGRPCTLVMAGADSRFNYAARAMEIAGRVGVSDSVRIIRDIPDSDVPLLYSAADVFISPSDNLQETFGQTVIEAMASELPVICSDWDGYRDLVVDGKTGYLIPTYWQECDSLICDYSGLWEPSVTHFYLSQTVTVDVELMAAALRELISSAELRASMGAEGRRRVLELYDWSIVIQSYADLWEELNQLAASQPFARQPSSWFRPSFFSTFKHYATSMIEPVTQVRATNNENSLPWYEELDTWIKPEVLHSIREHSQKAISVEELEAVVRKATGASLEGFRFHLLWMLKYNEMKKM
jgi:glycosyltransferase involved in cell wall biosynthesis